MNNIIVRSATLEDATQIAPLALKAGDGIPAYFWERALDRDKGQTILDVGIQRVSQTGKNFSFENALVAEDQDQQRLAGLVLGYILKEVASTDDITEAPDFLKPLLELEQKIQNTFYINMLATHEQYYKQGIGAKLMQAIHIRAINTNADIASLMVFSENIAAVNLYKKLGYKIVDQKPVVPHSCYSYREQLYLMVLELKS